MARPDQEDSRAKAQDALLKIVERDIGMHGVGDGEPGFDPRVRAAMARVPRDRFVPSENAAKAYDNRPLPIGHRQTISQPLIVAAMTQLLRIRPDARILEIGTGSGYQTAVLAELAAEVSTIEIVEPLANRSREVLDDLGYRNVTFRCGDGAAGWPERSPFDGIIVTAAAPSIPPALIEQLKPGGRLVIPVGARAGNQELVLVEKDSQGQTRQKSLFGVAFVPLTSESDDGS